MELREAELEKLAIEEFEAAGLMVFKIPKFYDRKHRARNNDLGSPDLLIFNRGRFIGVEMKAGTRGRQSLEQKSFMERMRSNGGLYFVARSLDDCDNIIRAIMAL